MALMSSPNNTLSQTDRATLLAVARQSIASGLQHGCALEVDPQSYPESLRPLRSTFVTLQIDARLRGCIGALEAYQPLVKDVAEHAYAAAFEDPRFAPLRQDEFPRLAVHIAVLSPLQPLQFESEDDLLAQLRPGIDGVVLHLHERRATFLPAVWEDLSEPSLFLTQLKHKAGLPLDYWSDEIQIERYTSESFGAEDVA